AGDVNGDGFADVIVGANNAGNSGGFNTGAGAAYVVFGKSSFVSTPTAGFSVALASLNGATGFKLAGIAPGDQTGYSAAGAGDVNGDGFDDVIVGAFKASSGATGAAYVVFGKSQFTSAPATGFSIG